MKSHLGIVYLYSLIFILALVSGLFQCGFNFDGQKEYIYISFYICPTLWLQFNYYSFINSIILIKTPSCGASLATFPLNALLRAGFLSVSPVLYNNKFKIIYAYLDLSNMNHFFIFHICKFHYLEQRKKRFRHNFIEKYISLSVTCYEVPRRYTKGQRRMLIFRFNWQLSNEQTQRQHNVADSREGESVISQGTFRDAQTNKDRWKNDTHNTLHLDSKMMWADSREEGDTSSRRSLWCPGDGWWEMM